MKALVVEIQSKSYCLNKVPKPYRLVALQFDLGLTQGGTQILRLPESCLGVAVTLDDEVDVHFSVKREEPF